MGITQLNVKAISDAVINIRSSKLPNPKEIGNAGSFFKNPILHIEQFREIEQKFPNIIAHPISDNSYKISAGWLIEACGWKGIKKGNVGCYEKHALVIISYGIQSGNEVFDFSEEIIQSVAHQFNIVLEREVNVY